MVRLNTAHMSHEDARLVIENTRAVSDKIGILLDTKGPEIRTCASDEALAVKYGDTVRIKGEPQQKSAGDTICVSYEEFVKDVPVGSSILIDDGYVALAVIDKDRIFSIAPWKTTGLSTHVKALTFPQSTSSCRR